MAVPDLTGAAELSHGGRGRRAVRGAARVRAGARLQRCERHVRAVVGQVKPTTYNLPPPDYVYGKVENNEEEGAREGEYAESLGAEEFSEASTSTTYEKR